MQDYTGDTDSLKSATLLTQENLFPPGKDADL